jgi:hypothetical protein
MKLPAIEQFHVLGLHEPLQRPSWTWSATLFPEGASNFQRLKLYDKHLHAGVLALLITSCKALRHSSYSQFSNSGGNCRPWNNEPHYKKQSLVTNFRVIIRALEKQHDSLQTLAMYNMCPWAATEL